MSVVLHLHVGMEETNSDKHSAADGFKSVPPYHYKSCIRKRRRRFNLENNKPCAKYRREVNKSEENSAGGMCPAFGPDKNLYAQVELGRRGSLFWRCKNTKSKRRGQNKVSTNTRGASSLQWKSHNRHLSFRITSSAEPGPSVLCQQPGTGAELYRGGGGGGR